MILFLDDDVNRRKCFRSAVPSAHIVETAQATIEVLQSGEQIDQLFLDHDLGDEVFVDSDRPDTGMEVVRWIEKEKPEIGEIVVHSHNPSAAETMVSRLRAAGYICHRVPFIQLKEQL